MHIFRLKYNHYYLRWSEKMSLKSVSLQVCISSYLRNVPFAKAMFFCIQNEKYEAKYYEMYELLQLSLKISLFSGISKFRSGSFGQSLQ